MRVLQERRLQGVVSRRADEERARANREKSKNRSRYLWSARKLASRRNEAAAIFDAGGKSDGGEVPKGWEEEYSMARLAEEGGSPRAREEVAEKSFGRVAWDSNGRNSSSASSLTPSQRISLLRGRSEMFSGMYDALFDDDEDRGSQEVGEVWIWVQEGIHKTFRRNSGRVLSARRASAVRVG